MLVFLFFRHLLFPRLASNSLEFDDLELLTVLLLPSESQDYRRGRLTLLVIKMFKPKARVLATPRGYTCLSLPDMSARETGNSKNSMGFVQYGHIRKINK